MTIALTVFNAQVDILIQVADGVLASASRDALIKQAVEQYSKDQPDKQTDDLAGDGGRYYAISDLSDWVEGMSRISKIQYPAPTVASDETPIYLDPADWDDDYWAGDTRYLYLPNHAPAATESMRITYTVPWAWSGDPEVTSIPASDFYAVCQLAACYCCRVIATRYSESTDSTIAADATNHLSRAQEFANRADAFCEAYSKALGLDAASSEAGPGSQPPAGMFVQLETAPSWPGHGWVGNRGRG